MYDGTLDVYISTHLVADKPEGDKFNAIVAEGNKTQCRIVNSRWVNASHAAGRRLPEDFYCTPPRPLDAAFVVSTIPETDSLSGCSIFLLGFSAGDANALSIVTRRSQATRYTIPSPSLTHIVVADDSGGGNSNIIGSVRDALLAHCASPAIVGKEWLLCSAKLGVKLPSKPFVKSLQSGAQANRGAGSGVTGVASDRSESALRAAFQPVEPTVKPERLSAIKAAAKEELENALAKRASEEDHAIRHRLAAMLRGVAVAVYPVGFMQNAIEAMQEVVVSSGGEVCPADTFDSVEAAADVAASFSAKDVYVIVAHGHCPLPLSDRECPTVVEEALAAFVGSGAEVVSPTWLGACEEGTASLWPSAHITFTPLPRPFIPFAEGRNFTFCVSGYQAVTDRHALVALSKAAGANYRGELTGLCSHLITDTTTTQKYKAAPLYGVKTVSAAWLYHCIHEGYVEGCEDMFPLTPIENGSTQVDNEMTVVQPSSQSSTHIPVSVEMKRVEVNDDSIHCTVTAAGTSSVVATVTSTMLPPHTTPTEDNDLMDAEPEPQEEETAGADTNLVSMLESMERDAQAAPPRRGRRAALPTQALSTGFTGDEMKGGSSGNGISPSPSGIDQPVPPVTRKISRAELEGARRHSSTGVDAARGKRRRREEEDSVDSWGQMNGMESQVVGYGV